MAAKKCLKCGSTNPRFFTHCVNCGVKLDDDERQSDKTIPFIRTALILCIFLFIIFFVAIPAIQQAITLGENFSRAISVKPTETPRIESSLGRPMGDNNLQITINSARDGENTFNSNKFFLVTVSLKNIRESGNILVSSSDFELLDSEGVRYFPYGIGSKVMYDLSPTQETTAELTFIIPQRISASRILFTFPGTTALAGNRHVVTFIL